jgi:heavy metal efflux system protein
MRRKIVLCNVVGRDIGSFVEEARRRIDEEVDLAPGYFVTFGGQFESQQRAMKHLTWLMLGVILVIFVILFSSFGSVRQALLVILNIPTTLVGAIIALLVAGETMNVSSTIGLIALFGICVQNDIVLVGKINDLRRAGRSAAGRRDGRGVAQVPPHPDDRPGDDRRRASACAQPSPVPSCTGRSPSST